MLRVCSPNCNSRRRKLNRSLCRARGCDSAARPTWQHPDSGQETRAPPANRAPWPKVWTTSASTSRRCAWPTRRRLATKRRSRIDPSTEIRTDHRPTRRPNARRSSAASHRRLPRRFIRPICVRSSIRTNRTTSRAKGPLRRSSLRRKRAKQPPAVARRRQVMRPSRCPSASVPDAVPHASHPNRRK